MTVKFTSLISFLLTKNCVTDGRLLSYQDHNLLGLHVHDVLHFQVPTCNFQPLALTRDETHGDSLVVSVLDYHWVMGSGLAGSGLSRSNNGPVALCTVTLGLGLLNPPPLNGR